MLALRSILMFAGAVSWMIQWSGMPKSRNVIQQRYCHSDLGFGELPVRSKGLQEVIDNDWNTTIWTLLTQPSSPTAPQCIYPCFSIKRLMRQDNELMAFAVGWQTYPHSRLMGYLYITITRLVTGAGITCVALASIQLCGGRLSRTIDIALRGLPRGTFRGTVGAGTSWMDRITVA